MGTPPYFFRLPARQKTVFQACLLPNEQDIEPYKHYSGRFNIRQTPCSASS
ncbi:toxin-antitoxin system HicB family antitoxin [Eikenella halliae]|uniref:toxin-antitoxin system HicB family antitoxin n=1 Tax=Eikenella halliae TaxID=1795832 RepID=UPI003614AEB5